MKLGYATVYFKLIMSSHGVSKVKIGNVITQFIQTFYWISSSSGLTCDVWITLKKLAYLGAETRAIVMLLLNFPNLELHDSK